MKPWNEFKRDEELTSFEKFSIKLRYQILPEFNPRRLWNRFVKFPYQKLTRGFSDRDAWSGDMYLARQIAGLLEWYVKYGISLDGAYDPRDETIDPELRIILMEEARNSEYLHYASIFAEYGNNGPAMDETWVKEFGGVLDSELSDALQWLHEHFQALWD